VQPELKPLKIGDSVDELKAALRLSMVKVGIRQANMPAAEEKEILIDFVQRNFGSYTPAMVSEAFEMAIMGRLDCEDAKCYENFSCEYVGRVLSSYQRFLKASGQLKSIFDREREYQPPPAGLLPPPPMTNDQKIQNGREMWEYTQVVDFIFPYTFQALVDEKLIEYPMPKSLQEKYMAAAEIRMTKIAMDDRRFFDGKDRAEWVRNHARKLVCADYFMGKFEEGDI